MQYPTLLEYMKAIQDAGANLDLSTKATNAELNEAITDEFGVKYSKDGRKLLKAPQGLNGTYSIRKGTKIVCDEAFRWSKFIGCDSLTDIVILDRVTRIAEFEFCCYESLTDIVLPEGVTSIGGSAFKNCISLTDIVIPDSVTSIGEWAFRCCNIPTDLKQELSSRFGEEIF